MKTILSNNYINFAVSFTDFSFAINTLQSDDAIDTLKTMN